MSFFFKKREIVFMDDTETGAFRKIRYTDEDEHRSFSVPLNNIIEKKAKVTLLQQHRSSGSYIEYHNCEERERVPYDAQRNPEAHQFLLNFVSECFAKQDARIEVHAPLNHPTIVDELAVLAKISPEEAEQRIIWGQGGEKGDAHSATYNLHIPNPNLSGLDDDLITNLNHRHGLAYVQIGKQDLVKLFIGAGYLPEQRK